MKTNSKPRSVSSIVKAVDKSKITFDSYLQRKAGQWSPVQKNKLIDSILRGYPIPAVYAIDVSSTEESIIDGCQRTTTICDFVNNKFAFSSDSEYLLDGKPTFFSRKKFKHLPEVMQDKILSADITIITLSDYTNDELVEVFDRLNGGTPLSTPQKAKVHMSFEFAGCISRVADKPAFANTGLSPTQIKRDENQAVVVQSLMLIVPSYTCGGFSKTEVTKFLKYYVPNYRLEDLNKLADMVDALEKVVTEKNKALKKSMIPPILKAIEPIYEDESKLKSFKTKLDKFLVDPTSNTEYMAHATRHTTAAEHVQGRVAFFEKMAK